MNFFKRAITSIKRRMGKTLILLILVFVLGNVIAGAISIEQAVKNTEANMRKKIGAIATAELDYEKMNKFDEEDYKNLKYINTEQINKIGELSYVKHYDYTAQRGLQTKTLKRYVNPDFESEMGRSYGLDGEEVTYFSLYGGQNTEPMEMKENKIKLVEGRLFTQEEIKSAIENKVLISKNLALTNNITIGSSIKLYEEIYKNEQLMRDMSVGVMPAPIKPVSTKEFEFEVIGIYDTIKEVKPNDEGKINISYLDEERENRIYTSNPVVINIASILDTESVRINPEIEGYNFQEYYTPIFVLEDPLELAKFKEEAGQFLPDYYRLIDNGGAFEQVAAPMKNMQWIASIVLYVAIGATLVILSLLITLFLRDRKHEIGIYLSLGEKKIKVIYQILTEVVIISFVAITLSLFSGNIIASVMSEKMLNNQIIAEQEKENSNNGGIVTYSSGGGTLEYLGYGVQISNEELIESYAVSLKPTIILMFYLIGLGTVLVSTLIPIVYIVRLNPKKIMM